jgi:hypothetical protein
VNCIFVFVQLMFEDFSDPSIYSKIVEPIFILLFSIELVMKFGAQGFKTFFRKKWNLYDLAVIIFSIIGLSLEFTKIPQLDTSMLVGGMRLIRMMKFIRYFSVSDKLRAITDTFFAAVPLATTQIIIIVLWYYAYGIIGMELFSGKLSRENPRLKGTDYDLLGFYEVSNFDNILNALLTEFHLMVVNNWHVTMKGAIAVTRRWSALYFIVFWLLTVIIFANLVVATVIDIFSQHFAHHSEEDKVSERQLEEHRPQPLQNDSKLLEEANTPSALIRLGETGDDMHVVISDTFTSDSVTVDSDLTLNESRSTDNLLIDYNSE